MRPMRARRRPHWSLPRRRPRQPSRPFSDSRLLIAPQPIPYQGSKRRLVPRILEYVPKDTATLWEPFVGSGALTIGAALRGAAASHVVSDTLEPLVAIWRGMLTDPESLSAEYEAIWNAQLSDPRVYYDTIRLRFNRERQPAQLLFLLYRCVKSAVRFNAKGEFNQSPDRRRLGTRPARVRARLQAVHAALSGRCQARCTDYAEALGLAKPEDVVYMDPPYMGVSGSRDPRYHQALEMERFVAHLESANRRDVAYLVSFDGHSGDRSYGPDLPEHLHLERISLPVGRSSQATLHGRADTTVESLYLSLALCARLREEHRGDPASDTSARRPPRRPPR